MEPELNETIKYRKKARKHVPKKADHKHSFKPCVFEYTGVRFDQAHGFVDGPIVPRMGSYCEICGKIGPADPEWSRWAVCEDGLCGQSVPTEDAKLQLNPETRTLPTFYLDDNWFQKEVKLPE